MKVILAYSGGLDTSVALHWLRESMNAEVVAFCADIGQLESLDSVRDRALRTGAVDVRVECLVDTFLEDFALPALQAQARYEGKYLLAAPLSRPLIAQRMVELAHETGADAVAHGATGKGNDQVRFKASVSALDPSLKVIAPVIEWDMRTRADEVRYAEENHIDVATAKSSPYSIDTNIWGTSIECGALDDVTQSPPSDSWRLTRDATDAPDEPLTLSIGFERGTPVSVDGKAQPLRAIVEQLNMLGSVHGVGRIDITESRIVGFKSRGVYEAPAATILMTAHNELEGLVLEREALHFKQLLSIRYAELVYYGYWFSDLRMAMDAFVQELQKDVTGEIAITLFKGSCVVAGRKSPRARYSSSLATYEEGDSFDHKAGAGFAYAWALSLAHPQGREE